MWNLTKPLTQAETRQLIALIVSVVTVAVALFLGHMAWEQGYIVVV